MRAAKKMASLLIITISLFCFPVIKGCDINAVTGGSIIVPLDKKLDPTDRLKWIFNQKVIFNKHGSVIVGHPDDITANGSLTLKNLQKKNAGEYKPEINDDKGRSKAVSSKHLCVFDPVKKPQVKMTCRNENVTLTCVFDSKEVSHQWYKNGKLLENEKKISLTQEAKKVQSDIFYCRVSNNASSEDSKNVSISSIKDCIKSTGFTLPEQLFGISIWIFIGGGGGIVLVLIIIVIFCCVRARRKKHMRLMDEQELRLEWSNPEQKRFQRSLPTPPEQHPPHQQRRRQQQQQADYACHAGKAGHTGPRQSRPKQQLPTGPETPTNQPQPSPRRGAQVPKPVNNADEEQPPPLPQPRKKRP